jgi:hypothetical protein
MSNINYLSINENFPVAGQDNDTQVFRDNFDTIKTSLRAAQEEVTDLQNNTAKTNVENNFNDNEISNAVFRDTMFKKFDVGMISGTATQYTVDFENGSYQVIRVGSNLNIDFQNLPENSASDGPIGVGKITLELYGDGLPRTLAFLASSGATFRRNPDWPEAVVVSSMSAPVIIDVWRHNATYIFMHYHGQYS